MNVTSIWTNICHPGQIFAIYMTALILFDIYLGSFFKAITDTVFLCIGSLFIWILCSANMEFVAYALLAIPVIFSIFLFAIVLYDQTLLGIREKDLSPCAKKQTCEQISCSQLCE